MVYHLIPVANGWLLTFSPDPDSESVTYVFEKAQDVGDFLAERHRESRPRKLIEDWH